MRHAKDKFKTVAKYYGRGLFSEELLKWYIIQSCIHNNCPTLGVIPSRFNTRFEWNTSTLDEHNPGSDLFDSTCFLHNLLTSEAGVFTLWIGRYWGPLIFATLSRFAFSKSRFNFPSYLRSSSIQDLRAKVSHSVFFVILTLHHWIKPLFPLLNYVPSFIPLGLNSVKTENEYEILLFPRPQNNSSTSPICETSHFLWSMVWRWILTSSCFEPWLSSRYFFYKKSRRHYEFECVATSRHQ